MFFNDLYIGFRTIKKDEIQEGNFGGGAREANVFRNGHTVASPGLAMFYFLKWVRGP